MAAQKLTATKIDKYRPTKNDESLADGNGLYLRFRRGQTGTLSRVWMYAYKIGSKSIYITLGDHEASLPEFDIALYKLSPAARLTLETARRIAAEISDWRKRGLQPKEFMQSEILRQAAEVDARAQVAAAQSAQAATDSLTVQDMFEVWTTDGVRRKDGNAMLKRMFAADVLPAIGAVAIKDVTEHHLRAVLRAMVERGVNRSAVMQRNSLTQMFAWARKRQPWRKLLVDGDPMELIEIEKIVSPDYDLDNMRDRILSADEIRELNAIITAMHTEYEAAPDKRVARQPLEATTERAIWIMLSTMCRVGETAMARWEHVDLAAGTWFIPKENVKDNIADLTVYLSAFALDQFKQLHAHTGHSAWCFPARNNAGSIEGKSISKQVGDRQSMFKKNRDGTPRAPLKNRRSDDTLVLAGGKNGSWTPHDLRRTGATMMQALGISLEQIDRCQNHVLPGSKVRRHYMLHDYANEKRAAWSALGESLAAVLT
ncbi:tyrosine-type recombinase/integrase [Janthinobacterium aquaticum]|uniref:tyrosine-type recombinase/integrase n=1 Tax=Janthinobacterium sp. FT58W TaxID=2654254 RepID=UPI001D02AE7E|nr:site-specific integrase [Janthinobacterium sp. FT58W]